MENKYVIKNIDKYKDIKLATGLDLMSYATKKRYITKNVGVGISTGTYGERWFKLPKGNAIFKTFDGPYGENIKAIRMANELICQELCKQVGISCAEYEPAKFGDDVGIVSYNMIEKNEKQESLHQFMKRVYLYSEPNLEDFSEVLDRYMDRGYWLNKQQMMVDLYKLIVFDYITLQTDRNASNVNVIFRKDAKKCYMAPVFDNEFAFGGEVLMTLNPNYEFSIPEYICYYREQAKMVTVGSDNPSSNHRLRYHLAFITMYAKKYPVFMKVLNNMLQKINPQQAFENLEKQGHQISKEYKEFVCELVEHTKQMLKDAKKEKVSQEEIADLDDILTY